ncbi:MAG: hypothetical protein V5B40_17690 [Candidatus Accumulibacter meliphilus]|jgi:hypothetical protein|uniref:hypothetical protein n=1 Tax=Candidatus Accumulibacter meliphilus TaxID=2211374 RepID=UPI002FC292CB
MSIGLVDDQMAAIVETRCRPGEGEGDEQAEQGEDRPLDGTHTLRGALRSIRVHSSADAPTEFEKKDHAQEKSDGERSGFGIREHGWMNVSFIVKAVR